MRVFLRFALVFSLLTVVTACSTFFGENGVFRSRAKDYLNTGTLKKITVPKDTRLTSLEELYVIQDVSVRDDFGDEIDLSDYEIPRPQEFSVDKSGLAVKIQSQLGRRWIFLNVPTTQVWPQTQSFLAEFDITVRKSLASEGLIETDWVHFKGDKTTRVRYRIMIEKGVHPDTTEVHVRQIEFPVSEEPLESELVWPEESDNKEREKWLSDALAKLLADSVTNNAASLMGQNVGGQDKVAYASVAGEPALNIRMAYPRARSSVTYALKSESFASWKQDSDKKLFYFDYLPVEDQEIGFFGKMAFWKDKPALQETPAHDLEAVLRHLHDAPNVRKLFDSIGAVEYASGLQGASGYLLVMQASGTGQSGAGAPMHRVLVRDYRGRPLPTRKAKEILRLVRTNLL